MTYVILKKGKYPHKWIAEVRSTDGKIKNVKFGHQDYSDYTIHKDIQRKQRYLNRHKKAETWTAKGITTAGFWSRWLLWNLPSLKASAKNITKRFGVKIYFKTGK